MCDPLHLSCNSVPLNVPSHPAASPAAGGRVQCNPAQGKHAPMARPHGTHPWHAPMAHTHGTPLWHAPMAHTHGTPPWHTPMAHPHGTPQSLNYTGSDNAVTHVPLHPQDSPQTRERYKSLPEAQQVCACIRSSPMQWVTYPPLLPVSFPPPSPYFSPFLPPSCRKTITCTACFTKKTPTGHLPTQSVPSASKCPPDERHTTRLHLKMLSFWTSWGRVSLGWCTEAGGPHPVGRRRQPLSASMASSRRECGCCKKPSSWASSSTPTWCSSMGWSTRRTR